MKKFKLFNIRTFVVIALSQIIGIYFASYFPSFGVWARIIPVIVLTAVFVPYIIFCPHEKRLVACVTAVIGLAMVFHRWYNGDRFGEKSRVVRSFGRELQG